MYIYSASTLKQRVQASKSQLKHSKSHHRGKAYIHLIIIICKAYSVLAELYAVVLSMQ
jgi:hypothetical protein